MIRVTADTNIYISALIFPGGKPFHLLELAREGKINVSVSEAILDEIGGVLATKFNWPPGDIAEARKWITVIARTVRPAVQLDIIKEDPPDNRILECAVAARLLEELAKHPQRRRLAGVYAGGNQRILWSCE